MPLFFNERSLLCCVTERKANGSTERHRVFGEVGGALVEAQTAGT